MLVEKPMTVKLADAEAIAAARAPRGARRPSRYGWNYSRLAIWAKEMIDAGRIGRVTSVTGYKASCLTDLFSGRSGYGVVDVGGFPVEVEAKTWARADAGGGYLYGQLSHLLGLGLLARAEQSPRRCSPERTSSPTAATSTSRCRCSSPTA